MRQLNPHVLVFSVFRSELPERVNLTNHELAKAQLEAELVPFHVVEGVYNGSSELSFVLTAQFRYLVEEFCTRYDQNCYLDSDTERRTKLVFMNGVTEQHVGTLVPVSEAEAKRLNSYTFSPATKTYYVTR